MTDRSPLGSRGVERGREPSFNVSSTQLGVFVLFVSLTVLFTASLVAYIVTSIQSPRWVPLRVPNLWLGLGVATSLLVVVTLVLHRGLGAIRKNQFAKLSTSLVAALLVAVAFLAIQSRNWLALARTDGAGGFHSLASFSFYLVTVLHALHVLAGLIPLSIAISRARRKEYTSSRYDGLKYCVQYWDFLLGIWFVLLTTIYLR